MIPLLLALSLAGNLAFAAGRPAAPGAIRTQVAPSSDSAAPIDPKLLAQILSEPQFAQRTAHRSGLSALAARLWDVLKELLQQRVVKGYSSVARAVFLAAVLLAMLALARAIFRRRIAERGGHGPREAAAPSITREPSLDAMVRDADLALSRGALREAVRGHMRAALRALALRGLADPAGARTNREVVRALEALGTEPDTAALMRALTGRFDAFVYGEAPLRLDDVERFIRDAGHLRARVGAG